MNRIRAYYRMLCFYGEVYRALKADGRSIFRPVEPIHKTTASN